MDKIITRCKQEIAQLEAKRAEILENGQDYGISGSHNVKNVKLAEIDSQLRAVRLKLIGYCSGGRTAIRPIEVTRYE